MVDPAVSLSGSAGWSWLRRLEELAPYETDYAMTELTLGMEWAEAIGEEVVVGPVVEVSYGFLGGTDENRGSHRHHLMARGGGRLRLFDLLFLDLKAGAGGAMNALDFGKGFPLPTEYTVNVQGQVSVGGMICLGSGLCLTPLVQYTQDMAVTDPLYTVGAVQCGFHLGGHTSGETDHAAAETPLPGTVAPHVELVERVVPMGSRLRTPEPESTPYIRFPPTFPPSSAAPLFPGPPILFANDNPDIDLRPAWYEAHGQEMSECLASPTLDDYAWRIDRCLAALHTSHRDVRLTLRVQGYANDYGSPEHNARLPWARAQNVIDYWTRRGPISRLKEIVPEDYATRRQQIQDRMGIDIETLTRNDTCGTHDRTGRKYFLLTSHLNSGRLTIINDTPEIIADVGTLVRRDFGAHVDAGRPEFRRVEVRVEVTIDGQPLSPTKTGALLTHCGGPS
ncbi:MAG: hypothetical protein HYV02_03440 [Deltaproteobacteria bacterium]|nr:hypothetical protein [Deltaproteobacteria bacterium]